MQRLFYRTPGQISQGLPTGSVDNFGRVPGKVTTAYFSAAWTASRTVSNPATYCGFSERANRLE